MYTKTISLVDYMDKTDFYIKLGLLIKLYRINSRYENSWVTQIKLAELMSVSANTVSRWEDGSYKITLFDLNRFFKILNIDPIEFMKELIKD